jgi:hypothetical protein
MPPQPARLGDLVLSSFTRQRAAPAWRSRWRVHDKPTQADQQAPDSLEAHDASVSLDKAMFASHFQS